jgi:hypothetical protein
MTPNPYNEDHLVEQPALALLASPHRRSSQSTRVRPAETSSPLVKGK